MTQVPTWLAFATPTVALLALCVAAGSFVVAVRSYRLADRTYQRAGPSVVFQQATASDGNLAQAIIVNEGLARVQVEQITIQIRGLSFFLREPFWLEGGETKYVNVPLSPSPPLQSGNMKTAHIRLGNGERIGLRKGGFA